MKKHIFIYIMALMASATNANAQTEKIVYLPDMVSVTEDTIFVELKDTNAVVTATSHHTEYDEKDQALAFRMMGGKGKVSIGDIGDIEVDNTDIFAHMHNINEYSADVYMKFNTRVYGEDANYGFIFSMKPMAEPTHEAEWHTGTLYYRGEMANLMNGDVVDVKAIYYDAEIAKLTGLKYNSTYYVRPYVVVKTIRGNKRMYGGEECFTTLRTLKAFYANENYGVDRCELVLSSGAIESFYTKYANRISVEASIAYPVIASNWAEYMILHQDMKNDVKKMNSTSQIECTDGTVYVSSIVPDSYAEGFLHYMLNEDKIIDPVESFYYETYANGKPTEVSSESFSDETGWVTTDTNPYGGYFCCKPTAPIGSAKYSFKLPSFLPGKYMISVTFAPGIGEEDVQSNKISTELYSFNEERDWYDSSRVLCDEAHADGNNAITNTSEGCDTVTYTTDLAGQHFLKITPGGKSSEIKNGVYTKEVRIAEIKVTPVEK